MFDHNSSSYAIAGGLILLPSLSYYIMKRVLTEKTTILCDIPNLGVPRSDRIQGTALICGGSIAGLWAARVCADHFDDVLIIEPEEWLAEEIGQTPPFNADGASNVAAGVHKRTRVMQYRSTHLFQPLLMIILRRLYPNIDDLIKNCGGRLVPASGNVYSSGVRTTPLGAEPPVFAYPNNKCPQTYSGSRDSYERLLRRLILHSGDRIRWKTGTVTALQISSDSSTYPKRIDSVIVRSEEMNTEHYIPASLVIDCSGASQAGLRWFKHLSDSPLKLDDYKIIYNPRMRYKEFFFDVPLSIRDKLPIPGGYNNAEMIICSLFSSPPREHRTFVMVRSDGHRIFILCGGWGDPLVPKESPEIIDWLKSFHVNEPIQNWIYETLEILSKAENKPDSSTLSNISCSWVQYHRMPNIPSNFIATGDAVMRLNPIFGQGCMKACVDAVTLDKVLRSVYNCQFSLPHNFSSMFFRRQLDRIEYLWESTKASDYAFDTTTPVDGETLEYGGFSRRYTGLLSRLRMKGDEDAVSAVWHTRMFLGPPISLFSPKIIFKILIQYIRQKITL